MVTVIVCACGGGASKQNDSPAPANNVPTEKPSAPAPAAVPSQEQLTERYRAVTEVLADEQALDPARSAKARSELTEIAELAIDPHLRANASLAAGALHEEAGDVRSAIAFFRQAVAAVPDEAPTHAMLALALFKSGETEEAVAVQRRVVELVPNDLEAWLHLGEMNVKAGHAEAAGEAYGTYEAKRKSILDGLTLTSKSGEYLLGEDDRVAMAAALEVAADNGTGLALLYALKSDPSPAVRAEVARVMGTQRLLGYKNLLRELVATESDESAKAAMTWALEEIERNGRETAPGPVPVTPTTAPDSAKTDAAGG